MAQRNRPAKSSGTSSTTASVEAPEQPAKISIEFTPEDWQQIIGMLEQGTSVILSQLAMQQGGLTQVATLSALANKHIDEIKKQVG